jgi:MOSC domain-containing protein YiiM
MLPRCDGRQMRVVSLNTGEPREIHVNGNTVRTSIWKHPRSERLRVGSLNIEGDEQSDLMVHGGAAKAVYCYPSEHYAYWRTQLPDADQPWGVFGENLTTEGMLESDVSIGDRFRAGSAEFVVTQPRQPCFKLGIRFGRDDMVKRFLASARSGFYVAVVQEGTVAAGDRIEFTARSRGSMTVHAIVDLRRDDAGREAELRRASALADLSGGWREHFRKRLTEP